MATYVDDRHWSARVFNPDTGNWEAVGPGLIEPTEPIQPADQPDENTPAT